MTAVPAHPGRELFLNLPVADLDRSVAFFAALGFTFNPHFTDETASCMLVGEHAYVMLLTHPKFGEFTSTPPTDLSSSTPAIYAFSVPTREQVGELLAAAVDAGGTDLGRPQDYGFMCSAAFPFRS